MSKQNRWRTAEELMRELEKDPAFRKRRAAREEKFRRLRERLEIAERPILDRLAHAGFPVDSIDRLVERYGLLPPLVVQILLDSIRDCEEERIVEWMVRALGAAEKPFNGRPLVECYERSKANESLRFAILNTIALAKPHSIDEWLTVVKRNAYVREMLAELTQLAAPGGGEEVKRAEASESDDIARFELPPGLSEASMSCDREGVAAFLGGVSDVIGSFGASEIVHVVSSLKDLEVDETREFSFDVAGEAESIQLIIRIVKVDVGVVNVSFFAPKRLAERIRVLMEVWEVSGDKDVDEA